MMQLMMSYGVRLHIAEALLSGKTGRSLTVSGRLLLFCGLSILHSWRKESIIYLVYSFDKG